MSSLVKVILASFGGYLDLNDHYFFLQEIWEERE